MIEYPIYISMTVLLILVQTDPLSVQQYIITGHKLYFTVSICVNERALDTYCTSVKAVELHHGVAVAILLI